MRVKVQLRADSGKHAGEPLGPAVGERVEVLVSADILVDGEATHPVTTAMRVHFIRGHRMVTDGPFMETKELIGD